MRAFVDGPANLINGRYTLNSTGAVITGGIT
jgi:hypothetical protein